MKIATQKMRLKILVANCTHDMITVHTTLLLAQLSFTCAFVYYLHTHLSFTSLNCHLLSHMSFTCKLECRLLSNLSFTCVSVFYLHTRIVIYFQICLLLTNSSVYYLQKLSITCLLCLLLSQSMSESHAIIKCTC